MKRVGSAIALLALAIVCSGSGFNGSSPGYSNPSTGIATSVGPAALSPFTGALGVTGATGDGSDFITCVNANGVQNPCTFGVVSGNTGTTTGTIANASAALTLASGSGFNTGNTVRISQAGAASGLSKPVISSVVTLFPHWIPNHAYTTQIIQDSAGNLQQATTPGTSSGTTYPPWSNTLAATTTDGTVTWTNVAALSLTCPAGTCTTTYSYQVIAMDRANGWPVESDAVTVSNLASIAPGINANKICITPAQQVETYLIYRGGTLAAELPNTSSLNGNTTVCWIDKDSTVTLASSSADVPTSLPGSSTTNNDSIEAKIASIVGTAAVIDVAAGGAACASGGCTVYHDDAELVNRAIRSLTLNTGNALGGGEVRLQRTTVAPILNSPIMIGNTGSTTTTGVLLTSLTPQANFLTAGIGMTGEPMVEVLNGYHDGIRNLYLWGNAASPPSAGFETRDGYNLSAGPGIGYNFVEDSVIGGTSALSIWDGIAITADPSFDTNNNNHWFNNVQVQNPIDCSVEIGHRQSVENSFNGGSYTGGYRGILCFNGGSGQFNSLQLGALRANATSTAIRLDTGQYLHDITFSQIPGEIGAGNLLFVDSTAIPASGVTTLKFTDDDINNGLNNSNNWEDYPTTMPIRMIDSHVNEGTTNPGFVSASPVTIVNSRLGTNAFVCMNTTLNLLMNTYSPGSTSIIQQSTSCNLNEQWDGRNGGTPTLGSSGMGVVYKGTVAAGISQIPTCNAAHFGMQAFVTDGATACSANFWAAEAGSGANTCRVFCDGGNWRID